VSQPQAREMLIIATLAFLDDPLRSTCLAWTLCKLSIQLLKLTLRPPSNIDIDSLRADPKAKPKPMDEPTYGTYLLLRQKLGVIVARVSRLPQSLTDGRSHMTFRDSKVLPPIEMLKIWMRNSKL
jgi:hypothetical protein